MTDIYIYIRRPLGVSQASEILGLLLLSSSLAPQNSPGGGVLIPSPPGDSLCQPQPPPGPPPGRPFSCLGPSDVDFCSVPGPGPAFYLSSYTHHSYRRARARPGPGILSFITIYPSLLLAGILSFITIYQSLLLAGILSFITIYPSLHYTKKWPGRVSCKHKRIRCKQPNKKTKSLQQ